MADDLARDDLAADDLAGELAGPNRDLVSVVHLGHLTDFQIADVQSPGRFEFFEQLRGRPGDESFVPAFRPQEALATHAVAAMVATLNRLPASPETGAPLGLCISTGDSLGQRSIERAAMVPGPAGRRRRRPQFRRSRLPGRPGPGLATGPRIGVLSRGRTPRKTGTGFPLILGC